MGTHHRDINNLERPRLHGPKQPMEQDRVQHRAQDVLRLQPVEDLSARASANPVLGLSPLSSSLPLCLSFSCPVACAFSFPAPNPLPSPHSFAPRSSPEYQARRDAGAYQVDRDDGVPGVHPVSVNIKSQSQSQSQSKSKSVQASKSLSMRFDVSR